MGDSDTVSLTANIAGIIGLADVVFRSGKELYDICSRCKNAPAARACLLAEISASTSIVAQARIFLHDYQNSAFEMEDGHSLPDVKTILGLFGQEFDILCNIIKKSQTTARDGWLGQLTKNFQWAIDEQTMSQSCNRLHRLTASMIAALSVTGRRNDLVVRKELNITKIEVLKLTEATQNIHTAMNSLILTPLSRKQASSSQSAQTRLHSSRPSRGAIHRSRRVLRHISDKTQIMGKPVLTSTKARSSVSKALAMDVTPALQFTSPGCLEAINLLGYDNGIIELASPIYNDVTYSLTSIRNELVDITGDGAIIWKTMISVQTARFVGEIIDSILMHAHTSTADRLEAEAEQRRKAGRELASNPRKSILPGNFQSLPDSWMDTFVFKPMRNAITTSEPERPAKVKASSALTCRSIARDTSSHFLDLQVIEDGVHDGPNEVLGIKFTSASQIERQDHRVAFSFFSEKLLKQFARRCFFLLFQSAAFSLLATDEGFQLIVINVDDAHLHCIFFLAIPNVGKGEVGYLLFDDFIRNELGSLHLTADCGISNPPVRHPVRSWTLIWLGASKPFKDWLVLSHMVPNLQQA